MLLHENMRKEIFNEDHNSIWAKHPGEHQTLVLLEKTYYWAPHAGQYGGVCEDLLCLSIKKDRS